MLTGQAKRAEGDQSQAKDPYLPRIDEMLHTQSCHKLTRRSATWPNSHRS
jgi:hypothetical protein